MAKKKKKAGRLDVLLSAKKAHQYEVGAGGNIFDPCMSHVRGIRLPSLGLMDMLGFTALRDSCTVLVDGKPGSSKSSFAIDMFNWGLPYAAGGAIFDCENKAAFDIAHGSLNDIILWLPGQLVLQSCQTVEETQTRIKQMVQLCRERNENLDRDEQLPFIIVTDPLAGVPSAETKQSIKKLGYADRGHGGRVEALLWTIWLKDHETEIINLPVISVFVNHTKVGTEQRGAKSVQREYNPGGLAQNYATTMHIRCSKGKSYKSETVDGVSWEEIWLTCAKNSRGPTGRKTMVRKCSKRNEDGTTTFWWEWGRNTAEFLAGVSGSHPTREVITIKQTSKVKYSCPELGLENVDPGELGDKIMADEKLLNSLVKACRIHELKEFVTLTGEEYDQLQQRAKQEKATYLKQLEENS